MRSVCAPSRRVIKMEKTIRAGVGDNVAFSFVAFSLDIATERESGVPITVHAWHLPVTESLCSRHNKAVDRPASRIYLREWLVPPILLPVFFGLVVAVAVIVQW